MLDATNIASWNLSDVNGVQIFQGTSALDASLELNLSGLVPGVYFFNAVLTDGNVFQEQVIKE